MNCSSSIVRLTSVWCGVDIQCAAFDVQVQCEHLNIDYYINCSFVLCSFSFNTCSWNIWNSLDWTGWHNDRYKNRVGIYSCNWQNVSFIIQQRTTKSNKTKICTKDLLNHWVSAVLMVQHICEVLSVTLWREEKKNSNNKNNKLAVNLLCHFGSGFIQSAQLIFRVT